MMDVCVFLFTTLTILLSTVVSPIIMSNVQTTTETVISLSPGHVEVPVPIKPAENLDQLTPSSKTGHLAVSTSEPPDNSRQEEVKGQSICSPWFVCVHGNCTEGMSCSCHDGWAGLLCDQSCPEKCAPHGACVTSTSNEALCVCNETSVYKSGDGCVEKPPDAPTSTTQAMSVGVNATTHSVKSDLDSPGDQDCLGVFKCVHGSCQSMSLACDCHRGWKGQLCDQACELDCGQHGRCRESDLMLYCECDYPYTGDFCKNLTTTQKDVSTAVPESIPSLIDMDIDISQWFSLTSGAASETEQGAGAATTSKVTQSAVTKSSSTRSTGNLASVDTATLRNLAQRQCMPNFVCQHGYCPDGTFQCLCDQGWSGIFCNVPCNITCGENETCVIYQGESALCQCKPGYMEGRDCQMSSEDSSTDSNKTVYPMPTTDGRIVPYEEYPFRDLELQYGQLLPLAQRQCLSGVQCAYGNCSILNGKTTTCLCQPNFTGALCQVPCHLDCGPHGECSYDSVNKSIQCKCQPPYTGVNCSDIFTDVGEAEPLPTVWIACLVVVLFLLMVVLFSTLCVCLYKRRNITVMKVVHWFQAFEEDDSKEYDAFVSYSSSDYDRQFVLQTLIPRLEGRMCYSLCIHQRNFVAGHYISDNIVESVKQSRRTLLIVSPAFVSSGWCRFEYQMALQEMLHEKHRVLPIMIGDISSVQNEIDDTLRRILRTVTWLEYPYKTNSEQECEKFWKRLELSMPKKRPSQTETGITQSCLALPSSLYSVQDFEDKSSHPGSYLKSSECSNTGLIQHIVRIPASRLDFGDYIIKSNSGALDTKVENDQEENSEHGSVATSAANTSPDLPRTEPSMSANLLQDSCINPALKNSETKPSGHCICSPAESDQQVSSPDSSQDSPSSQDVESNKDCTETGDLPNVMATNCLAAIELSNQQECLTALSSSSAAL